MKKDEKMKDWSGDTNSIFVTLGASNHTNKERSEYDYYATDPKAAKLLLKEETFNQNIWECACGEKHLSKIFEEHGFNVRNSDIVNRCDNEVFDFLSDYNMKWDGDIITNPPYKYALEFTQKALDIIYEGNKVAMFLKLSFLEGKKRKEFFLNNPPKTVYVLSGRLTCAKNGNFEEMYAQGGGAVAYAWYVWVKGYKGDTIIKWIN